MVNPAFEIRMVKENLDLAMALLQAVQEEKVTARQLFRDGPEDMFVAFAVDNNGPDQIEFTRRAANQARAAFALSVIQTQRSLDRVFVNKPLEEENPDLQAARCVMFLLNNTVFPNLFQPVWNCPSEYRRRFEVRPISLLMDAAELHGKGLSWDHVGGLPQYLELLVFFANWVQDLDEVGSPVQAVQQIAMESEIINASPAPARMIEDSVQRFVDVQCEVGETNLVLAKDLYSAFQEWCRDTGQNDVSQRSFGMQLTALGLQRRRRGRGKHWWDGIKLTASIHLGEVATQKSLVGSSTAYPEAYQTELPT